jgi:protein-S-isoprenylcysteine O-methyltransferase Ste14
LIKIIAFVILSCLNLAVSWKSLHVPRSHGFYRFFAWEIIAVQLVLNFEYWISNPLVWYQIISWCLLIISIIPLVFGVQSLVTKGKPEKKREHSPDLLAFEKTTVVVTSGIYRWIRHPLYSSLLFLIWGIFFKAPSWLGTIMAFTATVFLVATAKADELECIRFFGPAYQEYMEKTKRFIPFLF